MKTKHFFKPFFLLFVLQSFSLATITAAENSIKVIAGRIASGLSLPPGCDPASSSAFLRTDGARPGLYRCIERNTWTFMSATAPPANGSSADLATLDSSGQLEPLLLARVLSAPSSEAALPAGKPAPAAASAQAGVGTCPGSQFVTAVNGGVPPTCAQPAFSNLSGSAAASQLPAATATTQGALQLSGDLSDTSGTPKVAGLQGKPISSATPTTNQVLTWSGSAWTPASSSSSSGGTVTSVGLVAPPEFSVSGAPVTASGNLTLTKVGQSANSFYAGPSAGTAGAPTFRSIAPADLPLATSTGAGAVQLSADLGGTGAAPLVAAIRGNPVASTAPAVNQVLTWNGSAWVPANPSAAGGTVTSVGLAMPPQFAVAGSPVSGSGSLTATWNNYNANTVLAGPASGSAASPAFRSLVPADLPTANSASLGAIQLAGDFGGTAASPQVLSTHLAAPLAIAQGGSGAGTLAAHAVLLGEGTSAFSVAGPGTSGQCLLSNGSAADPSFAACPAGAATPAGSTTQFEFNNAGAFGGTANLTYASSTGAVSLNQLANGNETLYGTRTTDTSPTGNLIHFQNLAKTADLFKVDASGNVTATSFTSTASGPFVMSGSEGACSGAAAGKDVLCLGDTSTHTAQLALNGGSFVPIPQLAGDLGGTAAAPQVVSAHLGHLNQTASNGDLAGTIALSTATSASHTFVTAFNSAPICVLTPNSDPGSGTRYWVTATATQVTANISSAMTITFNYHCTGNPN